MTCSLVELKPCRHSGFTYNFDFTHNKLILKKYQEVYYVT